MCVFRDAEGLLKSVELKSARELLALHFGRGETCESDPQDFKAWQVLELF